MKTLTSTVCVFLLVLASFVASQEHVPKPGMQGDMKMGMMSHEQMMAMHEHMKEMKALMDKIKHEENQEKRHDLLRQHMASMMKGMQMMNDTMGKGMPMENNGKMKKAMKDNKMMDMDMSKRMEMMESKMGMMQMMMQQMMEHDYEAKKMRVRQRKNDK